MGSHGVGVKTKTTTWSRVSPFCLRSRERVPRRTTSSYIPMPMFSGIPWVREGWVLEVG